MGARILACLGVAALLQSCTGLLFFPGRQLVRTPADLDLQYRDVALAAEDGTALHGWWLGAEGAARGTVLFLHGNAENISTHIGSVYWLPAAGYQVLLLDYRGFGRSTGKPRIPEVFTDIEAAFAWLEDQPEAAGRPLYLFGQSLGAALGGYVAATRPDIRCRLSGVVLESAFARYGWIAREVAARGWLTWFVQWPVGWSMPGQYDLLDVIGDIRPVPLMIVHGRDDGIVSYRHAEALFRAAGEPKVLHSHDDGHIAAFGDSAGRGNLVEFFSDSADVGRAGAIANQDRDPCPP